MRDLMIEIETLGTAPGSVILSVGAVTFDAETGEFGEEFYAAVEPQSAVDLGLTIDVSTLKWWMDQSEEARKAAFSGDEPLSKVLFDLRLFVLSVEPSRVWAKPPSFDIVLLESAYRACAITIPWHYRTPRDCRTLFDLTRATQPDVGTAHNALDDAKSQALGVIDAYRIMASRAA